MVTEEYIKELKQKFVTGTKYKCACSGNTCIFNSNESSAFQILYIDCSAVNAGFGKGFLYYDGKEAIIVSQPKNFKQIDNYYELW